MKFSKHKNIYYLDQQIYSDFPYTWEKITEEEDLTVQFFLNRKALKTETGRICNQ